MCNIGSKILTASETVENGQQTATAEWMSEVFKHSTSDSSTACFMLDLKNGEGAKRIKVELIYQDMSNTTHEALLLDLDDDYERLVTFEFLLTNVVQYQVC